MEVTAQLRELPTMHPNLLWEDIAAAAVATLPRVRVQELMSINIVCDDIPAFVEDELTLHIDCTGISRERRDSIRRTYDAPRLVEMAAIADAGLALYYGGRHEIRDVARRGTAADYLVDSLNHRLEVAGRSRRSDLETAWQQKVQRLTAQNVHGFYVCVVELETPSGRLTFVE